MGLIFTIVYSLLKYTADITGLSYNEINIVVYYIAIPFIYIALLDTILCFKYLLKAIYISSWTITILLIPNFESFSNWLFDQSVYFLLSFESMGLNYVAASVVICVFVPLILFIILFVYAYKHLLQDIYTRVSTKLGSTFNDADDEL